MQALEQIGRAIGSDVDVSVDRSDTSQRPTDQNSRHQGKSQQGKETQRDRALQSIGADQGDRDDVHRCQQRAEAAADDVDRDEHLEQVRRQAQQVEEERQRQNGATEEAGEPDNDEGRIGREFDRRADIPPAEKHEHQGQDAAQVRERIGRGDQDIDRRAFDSPSLGIRRRVIEACEDPLAVGGEDRQHDQQVARGKGGDQRAAEGAHDVAIAQRCRSCDEAGKEPEAHDQRDHDIDRDIDLQAAEIANVDRASGTGGDREDTVGGEPTDEAVDGQERVARCRQQVEDARLGGDVDQCHAEEDAEDDDGWNHRVRQRCEDVGRYVQL